MTSRKGRVSSGSGSVLDQWFAGLPDNKFRAFDSTVKDMESSYGMLSVSLDEAFRLRGEGALVRAREQVGITADLAHRLASQILAALAAIREHARQAGQTPDVAPLKRGFFRGKKSRSAALWQSILQRLLVSRVWGFTNKLSTLSRLVEDLDSDFRHTAEEIAGGTSVNPGIHWQALERDHYDVNTCLRETTIILKSFLLDLPDKQFEAFHKHLRDSATARLHRGPSFPVST